MKFKTTKRQVMGGYWKIIEVGYCDVQYLMTGLEPVAYTCGTYGWHAYVYQISNTTAIVTGYRPFGNISPDYDVMRTYESTAARIAGDYKLDYEERLERIAKLRREFVDNVLSQQ